MGDCCTSRLHGGPRDVSWPGAQPPADAVCLRSVPRHSLLICVVLLFGLASSAQAQSARVEIVDLTSRFLAFYDSATARHADPDTRWQMWRRLYGFAAVPPGPFGDSLARRLLDSAWTKYSAALETIRKGPAALAISPDTALARVLGLLKCGDSVKLRVTVFVGGFEGNAFAFGVSDGRSNLAVPVEAGDPERSLIHEFTHAVQRAGCAPFGAPRSGLLAELVVTEGLAMRVVQAALPGHDDEFYTTAAPGWLAAARERRAAVLAGVRAALEDSGNAAWNRFTFGRGATGLPREAYYAGWETVGEMLREGMSLHDIATLNPTEYVGVLRRVIDTLSVSSH